MKYLVKDEATSESIFVSGETKKEIIIKALQKYLTDDWSDDFIRDLENNFDLTFIANIEEL